MNSGPLSAIQRLTRAVRSFGLFNWALIDQMIVSGGNFLTGILLVRLLGVQDYGQFVLAWLVVLFVQSIQHSAVNAPMMSIATRQPLSLRPTYCTIVFVHQLLFGAVSTLLVIACMLLFNKAFPNMGLASLVWPLSLAVLATQTQDFLRRYCFTIERPIASFTSDLVRYGTQLTALGLLLRSTSHFSVSGTLWTITSAATIGAIAGAFNIPTLKWPDASLREISLRHWHFSKWMISSTLLTWISGNLSYVITAALLGPASVGILRAAQNVMAVTHVFLHGLENVLPIRASLVYSQNGSEHLMVFARRTAILVGSGTAVIALIVCALSTQLMAMLYGPEFRQYGWVLIGYAIIYVISSFTFILDITMRTLERTAVITLAYLCSITIFAAVTFPLIRWFGMVGVLIGLTFHASVPAGVMYCALKRLTRTGMASPQTKDSTVRISSQTREVG